MSTGWGPPSVPRPPVGGDAAPSPPAAQPSPSAWGQPGYSGVQAEPPPPPLTPTPEATPRKVRPAFLLALLIVIVGGAAVAWFTLRDAGNASDEGWARHDLPGGGVSVELPGDVRRESGTVWSGDAAGIDGSAIWTGDGGLERAAPGIVVLEGDAAQLGLDAATVEQLGPTLVDRGLDAFFEEVGAVEVDPAGEATGGGDSRRVDAAGDGETLVVVAAAVTSGTRVVGIVVSVPAAEEATADSLLDRVMASVEVDA